MKMFFEVGPENGYEKRMMALLHCHLEQIPDVWMIVSELVFSALDISLWIKFPETVVEFASPKKIGHPSVPKGSRIIVLGSQPWTPPAGDFHMARDHFGEISRSRCFLVWELNFAAKNGGPLTMYSTENWLAGKSSMNESMYVLLEDGGFSNVMLVLLECMVYPTNSEV